MKDVKLEKYHVIVDKNNVTSIAELNSEEMEFEMFFCVNKNYEQNICYLKGIKNRDGVELIEVNAPEDVKELMSKMTDSINAEIEGLTEEEKMLGLCGCPQGIGKRMEQWER